MILLISLEDFLKLLSKHMLLLLRLLVCESLYFLSLIILECPDEFLYRRTWFFIIIIIIVFRPCLNQGIFQSFEFSPKPFPWLQFAFKILYSTYTSGILQLKFLLTGGNLGRVYYVYRSCINIYSLSILTNRDKNSENI